jgi:hypothetical protein
MSTEIIFALCLWLLITLITPGKIRLFISFLAASLIIVLLFFSLVGPRDLLVSIPSFGEKEGYDLPYEDFQSLVSTEVDQNVQILTEAEALASIPKDILIKDDLSLEQLQAVGALPGSENFLQGREGIIIRTIPATVDQGLFVPAKHGIEFTPLPLYDTLEATKAQLNKTQNSLQTKEHVLEAIRDIVNDKQPNQM